MKRLRSCKIRKKQYEKGFVENMFEKGDRVLLRTLDLVGKLEVGIMGNSCC